MAGHVLRVRDRRPDRHGAGRRRRDPAAAARARAPRPRRRIDQRRGPRRRHRGHVGRLHAGRGSVVSRAGGRPHDGRQRDRDLGPGPPWRRRTTGPASRSRLDRHPRRRDGARRVAGAGTGARWRVRRAVGPRRLDGLAHRRAVRRLRRHVVARRCRGRAVAGVRTRPRRPGDRLAGGALRPRRCRHAHRPRRPLVSPARGRDRRRQDGSRHRSGSPRPGASGGARRRAGSRGTGTRRCGRTRTRPA